MARPYSSAELKEAAVLRQSGHSLASITEKTGLSGSTLYRHFRTHGVSKGAITSEAIEEARRQLITDTDFIGSLRHHIASSILDDLEMSKRIKASAFLALEQIEEDDSIPAMIKARSLAALSTAVKTASDIQRRCLRLDDPTTLLQQDDLPVLTINRMSDDEIKMAQSRFGEFEEDEVEESIEAELIED